MNSPESTGHAQIGFIKLSDHDSAKTNKTAQPHLHFNSTLINEFYLPVSSAASLDRYYVLHWTGHYLSTQLSVQGTITHRNVEYICVLPECIRTRFFQAHQIKLSFRKPKGEYGIPPYALVRFA